MYQHQAWRTRLLDCIVTVCGFWNFLQTLLFSAGAPRVSHPFLLLRDVLLCGRVAHPLSQLTTTGLSRLEVGIWCKGFIHYSVKSFNKRLKYLRLSVFTTNTCTKGSIIWFNKPFYFAVMQVYEQTSDELSRTLRPNDHHECWHPGVLSKRRLVQTGFLPPVILLLSLRVQNNFSAFFCFL